MRTEDVLALIEREGAQIATVMLPGVQFLNGQRFDLHAIARAAQRAGCRVGFDLAHAIGNVPLATARLRRRLRRVVHYKYLNAGPGAVGGCFVHERHARDFDLLRLAGWWGHDKASRFQMPHEFQPLPGAEGWQISNLPILAAAPLLASLPLFDAAGMPALRAKSRAADRLPGVAAARAARRLGDDPHARRSGSARLPVVAASAAQLGRRRARCSMRSLPQASSATGASRT